MLHILFRKNYEFSEIGNFLSLVYLTNAVNFPRRFSSSRLHFHENLQSYSNESFCEITGDAVAARRTPTATSSATTRSSSNSNKVTVSVSRKRKKSWGQRRRRPRRRSPCRAAPKAPIRKFTRGSPLCRCRCRVWRATGAPTASIRSQWRPRRC